MTPTWPNGLPLGAVDPAPSRHELHETWPGTNAPESSGVQHRQVANTASSAPGLVGLPPAVAAEAVAHVRRLHDHGWRWLPVLVADFDLQGFRRQGGYVDVLLLGPFGQAVLARYVDVHEPGSSPFAFQGRQIRRETLPSIEALRRAVGMTDPGGRGETDWGSDEYNNVGYGRADEKGRRGCGER